MNILDLIVILAAIAYGIGGFRNGAVVGLFSMIGFFGGAVIGAQIAEPLGSRLADGRAQIPIAIICVLFVAMLGQLLGVWAAGHVRTRIVRETRQAGRLGHRRGARRGVGAAGRVDGRCPAGLLALPVAVVGGGELPHRARGRRRDAQGRPHACTRRCARS